MNHLTIRVAVGLIALSCFSDAAAAGPAFCAERDQIAERLKDKYSEQQIGLGEQSSGVSVIELWTSVAGDTWTILMTRVDGVSCVMATGTKWVGSVPVEEPSGTAG